MAKKKKGELASGSIRRQVLIGTSIVRDAAGNVVLDANGKPKKKREYVSVTAATSREADLMAAQVKADRERAKKPDHITYGEAMDNYIAMKSSVLSPSTIRGYKSMHRTYAPLVDIPLSKITDQRIQLFINNLLKDHSVKYVKNVHGLITAVLSQYNLSVNVTLPRAGKKQRAVPTDEQILQLIEYFKQRNDNDMIVSIFLSAFGTLRRSEICGLRAEDIHGNIIHTTRSAVMDASGQVVVKDIMKNDTSDRYIELPAAVIALLPSSGPLVTITPAAVTQRFIKARDILGLEGITLHDMRHYSASIMHAIGVPDSYIMARGGWKTDNVMKAVYRGTMSDYEKKYADQTNTYFTNMLQLQQKPQTVADLIKYLSKLDPDTPLSSAEYHHGKWSIN